MQSVHQHVGQLAITARSENLNRYRSEHEGEDQSKERRTEEGV